MLRCKDEVKVRAELVKAKQALISIDQIWKSVECNQNLPKRNREILSLTQHEIWNFKNKVSRKCHWIFSELSMKRMLESLEHDSLYMGHHLLERWLIESSNFLVVELLRAFSSNVHILRLVFRMKRMKMDRAWFLAGFWRNKRFQKISSSTIFAM